MEDNNYREGKRPNVTRLGIFEICWKKVRCKSSPNIQQHFCAIVKNGAFWATFGGPSGRKTVLTPLPWSSFFTLDTFYQEANTYNGQNDFQFVVDRWK